MQNTTRPIYFCKARTEKPIKGEYYFYIALIVKGNDNTIDINSHVEMLSRTELLRRMKFRPGCVANLKLSADDKILVKSCKIRECADNKVRKHNRSNLIEVGELIEGHIVNQNVTTNCIRQKTGNIKECHKGLIVGTGYILNREKIYEIKQWFDDKCKVEVMTAEMVREELKINSAVRRRLATFYSSFMMNVRYMHLERIQNKHSRNMYEKLRKNYMSYEYLYSDPNLLYALYNLYGYHMYTFEHCINVAIYACLIYAAIINLEDNSKHLKNNLENLKYTREFMEDLFICGLLHDIGKMEIPCKILDYPKQLTDEYWKILKKHPEVSAKIISNLCECESAIFKKYKESECRRNRIIKGALWHHDKYKAKSTEASKKAYPHPKEAQSELDKDLPLFCAIISMADNLDAISSPRIYHGPNDITSTLKIIESDAETGKLDSETFKILKEILTNKYEALFNDEYGMKMPSVSYDKTLYEGYEDIEKCVKTTAI